MKKYFILALLFSTIVVNAQLLSDQGTNTKLNGVTLDSGTLTVEIWNSSTGGSLIYTETFSHSWDRISNGNWNVMLGFSTPLSLTYGQTYWKDYQIEGVDIDFTNQTDGSTMERLPFVASQGYIDSEFVNITDIISAINFSSATLKVSNATWADNSSWASNSTYSSYAAVAGYALSGSGNTTQEIISAANTTGYLIDWNQSGYIKDWNSTGYLRNWSTSPSTYSAGSNLTLTGTVFAVNMTAVRAYFDTLYILQSDEANLDVNSSDYWDSLNTPSDINISDLASGHLTLTGKNVTAAYFIGDGSQLTGLSTGGNSSAEMLSATEEYFVNITGDTMTGNLILPILNFTEIIATGGWYMSNISTCSNINASAYALFVQDSAGEYLPHLLVQPGGSGQASYIARSFMIINQNETILNSTNRTSCKVIQDNLGVTPSYQIDCNSSTTGADMLVSDDFLVGGDVRLTDSEGEWHGMNRQLTEIDNLFEETILSRPSITVSGTTFTIRSPEYLKVNINSFNQLISSPQTATLVEGTDTSPKKNYVYFWNDSGTFTLTNTETSPGSMGRDHVEVFTAIIGATTGTYYLYLEDPFTNRNFIYNSYERAESNFEKYVSGFEISSSADDLNFTSGEYWQVLTEFESSNNLALATDGFFWVDIAGNYEKCTSLTCIDEYDDGSSIASNAYYNVVWAVVQNSSTTSRLVAIPQQTPESTHTTATDAETDGANYLTYTIDDPVLNKYDLILARTIVKKSTGDLYAFSDGRYHKTLIGLPLAGAAAGGTNDHGALSGLLDDHHPQYLLTNGSRVLTGNLNGSTYNISAAYFIGDGSQLTGLPTGNTTQEIRSAMNYSSPWFSSDTTVGNRSTYLKIFRKSADITALGLPILEDFPLLGGFALDNIALSNNALAINQSMAIVSDDGPGLTFLSGTWSDDIFVISDLGEIYMDPTGFILSKNTTIEGNISFNSIVGDASMYGNLDVLGNVSADQYITHTPDWEEVKRDLGTVSVLDSLQSAETFKGKDGKIDHSKIPGYLEETEYVPESCYYDEDGKKICTETRIVGATDLGEWILTLHQSVYELNRYVSAFAGDEMIARMDSLEDRISSLENKTEPDTQPDLETTLSELEEELRTLESEKDREIEDMETRLSALESENEMMKEELCKEGDYSFCSVDREEKEDEIPEPPRNQTSTDNTTCAQEDCI